MEKEKRTGAVTKKEWADIQAAAELLGLEEKASLAEIKRAYRHLSRKYHPDMQKKPGSGATQIAMHEITGAYKALLQYCDTFRFPLTPADDEQLEAEDWWFERFGQDPLWGKGTGPEDEPER
jgi:hypothetical protein